MKICLVLHKYGVSLNDPCCYPLGYMYVAAWLKKQNHVVKVLNYNLWDYDYIEEIKDQDIVCFTGFEEFKDSILRDAEIAKAEGKMVWVGGALATFTPEVFDGRVDVIQHGEIEYRTSIHDISWPDYEAFDIQEYMRRHVVRYMGVLTSRGCPYSCSFCSHTCQYRCRRISDVEVEVDHYRIKYKIEQLVVNDNTLNINKSRFLKFCDMMNHKGVAWTAAIRPDIFDAEMAEKAKNSGCRYFIVGVESFNQKRLDYMNKRTKVESIYKTLDLLHKYKIGYHGNILFGFGDESYFDIANSLKDLPFQYNIFPVLLQPFIGTKIEQRKLSLQDSATLNDIFISFAKSRGLSNYKVI